MRTRIFAAYLLLAVFSLFRTALVFGEEQPSPFVGRWHVDLSRSTGSIPTSRKSVILNIVHDDAENYEDTETATYGHGHSVTLVTHAKYDGNFYPVKGSGHGILVAVQKAGEHRRHFDMKTSDGFSGSMMCEVSPDAKAMTCDMEAKAPDGHTGQDKSVYTRE